MVEMEPEKGSLRPIPADQYDGWEDGPGDVDDEYAYGPVWSLAFPSRPATLEPESSTEAALKPIDVIGESVARQTVPRNEQALAMVKLSRALQFGDIDGLFLLSRREGLRFDPFAESSPETVLKVVSCDRETVESRRLVAMNDGKDGFSPGPEINHESLTRLRAQVSLDNIVGAFRSLGIETVGAIIASRQAPSGFVWRLYYRE